MKILTKKQMRLDELIKYVWENELKADNKLLRFESQVGSVVEVDMSGQVRVYGQHYGNELFTVEVEEGLTEETVFGELVEIYYDYDNNSVEKVTATECSIKFFKEAEFHPFKSLAIFHKDTLIWSKDSGIPTEGVLKVG